MAVPKIFISSTYYDLKQERSNIADFIKSLGYEPVMHERAGVTYTQSETLENDCYKEIQNCDILVCIIGNHFGSSSAENNYSITMNELKSAMKDRKKIFIFIMKDVFVENTTYLKNKDSGSFVPAFADNIKIHEFIAELKQTVKKNPIIAFENTSDIIENLKLQFAGMFQRLLTQEATLTNSKTMYDLQETADNMKAILSNFIQEQEEFKQKFDCSVLVNKVPLQIIRNHLGLSKAYLYLNDIDTIDEFMTLLGFSISQELPDKVRVYTKEMLKKTQTLKLSENLFDENYILLDIRNKEKLKSLILWEEVETVSPFDDDGDIPF
ncbi:MAG: DUF4062 domain-containing protein [Clostridiales bacterium]|nr:DUF4062 domain-containing protein [Clostridiales bacterium]